MTREQIMALTGRDLDAAVAAAIGKPEHGDPAWWFEVGRTMPFYSASLDLCRVAEDVVDRRGLYSEYGHSLYEVLAALKPTEWMYMSVIRASAADRCRAILLTLEAAK